MVAVLLSAVELLLVAQATQAMVVGTVRDEATGAPVAGAVVELADLDRAVETDAGGRYILRAVPAGPQHVAVRRVGYAERSLHALVPRAGRLEINISMRPEPFPLESVDVQPVVRLRGVEAAGDAVFPDRTVSIAAVRNHPLLAEPDALLALGGGAVALLPESPTGFHVRGGGSDQTAYLLDGIPVFSPYHVAGVFSAWNPDAIASVQLNAASPSPALPDALSGVVAASTRAPGARFGAQGSLGTMQARVTLDGPLGPAGGGWLLSLRSGFAGFVAPRREETYLRAETGDRIAKLEARAFGGRLRLLEFGSENEVDAAADAEAGNAPPLRNAFEWRTHSAGAAWERGLGNLTVRIQAWRARFDAGARWALGSGEIADLSASRRDFGFLAAVDRLESDRSSEAGIRVERIATNYRIEPAARDETPFSRAARTPLVVGFARHVRPVAPRTELELAAAVAIAAGGAHPGPRAQLRWMPSGAWTLSASFARLHQFAQSLRNPESIVGTLFPVDLFVGAAEPDVPVARADQAVLAASFRPLAGVHLAAQAWERSLHGLVLVAPPSSEPFATGAVATGSGLARGASFEAAVSGARYGLLANWAWQRVRLSGDGASYVPEHGAAHRIEAGAIVFPAPTSSIRIGATGLLGRRSTAFTGELEWESCNLADQGCEFGGSPRYGDEPPGGARLPPYLRVDLGLRKHWHVRAGGRVASVALFGTITNVFGRANVLAWSRDPLTGRSLAIGMRPRAPLVVGLDWSF